MTTRLKKPQEVLRDIQFQKASRIILSTLQKLSNEKHRHKLNSKIQKIMESPKETQNLIEIILYVAALRDQNGVSPEPATDFAHALAFAHCGVMQKIS